MPDRWNNTAAIRRIQIETGVDITFNDVFRPLFINKIVNLTPKNVLEIGAGTGHLSKDLCEQRLLVTAIEPSKGMYDVAQNVLSRTNVSLHNCFLSELEQINFFDLAFSHLVAHVVEDLGEFLHSVNILISTGGDFIFSIPHPCFYNEYKNFFGDEYNYMLPMFKNVSFTINKDAANIIDNVPYHHRPLSAYINAVIKAGFRIESFDEIYPEDDIQIKYGTKWDTPRYCVFNCKKL